MDTKFSMQDPFAHLPRNPAADNNKAFILQALKKLNLLKGKVVELGSGPGQHGIHICQNEKDLTWQPTEIQSKLPITQAWYEVSQQQNISNYLPPFEFHIGESQINAADYDLVYSANVLHIISEAMAKHLAKQLAETMNVKQHLVCYGPFLQDGKFTTESNREFNQWLLSENYGGLRDLTDIPNWTKGRLELVHIESMPANNFLVVYQKR